MESASEVPLFSQLSSVSIKNYHDKIVVNLLPHLEQILETASAYASSNTITNSAVGVASEINELSSVVHLSYSNAQSQNAGRTLTVKEPPLEIIIEQPLDESSLVTLSRLLGEHTPTSMSHEETASLIALLEKNQVDHLKIKSTGVRFVFRILEQTFRPLYRLPPQFEHFTGRNQELAMLRERRNAIQVIAPREDLPEEEKHDKNISQIAGTGGIGKSQLANYYARLQFREKNYDWVIWMVGGEDDQRAHNNLSSQFVDLGLALGLDVKQLKDEVLHQLIYERLAAKGRGLVVVDDAPNYNIVKSFLPERFGQRKIDVLITTRNSRTFGPTLTKILLDVFTMEDAKRYIGRLLKEMVTEADAEVLATTLDRYPLALTQALAYILNNQCTIMEYCQRYHTLRSAQKKYLETPVYEDDPYQLEHQKRKRKFEATMQVVVQLSLEQVKALCKTEETYEHAFSLLMSTAYLAPEAAIPKSLLRGWLPVDEAEIQINEVLEAFRALSLLEEANEIDMYRIHQVVQDVLKIPESKQNTQDRIVRWYNIFRNFISTSSKISLIKEEEVFITLKPHAIILAQYFSQQPQIIEFLEAEALMQGCVARAFITQGEDTIALHYLESQYKCYQQMQVGSRLPALINQMNLSGEGLSLQNLAIIRTLVSEQLISMGNCMMNIACVRLSLGNSQGAKSLLEEALRILELALGDQHATVNGCWVNLARSMQACGDPKGAKKILEKALPMLIKILGEDHVDVGKCFLNLGVATKSCGDPASAKDLIEKGWSILKNSLGNQHPTLGACLSILGYSNAKCGNYQEGKRQLEEALWILKGTFGENHVAVGGCYLNLGSAILLSDEPPQVAKTHFEKALYILKTKFGVNHCEVGMALMQLGWSTVLCGDHQRGKRQLEEALPILKSTLGEHNPEVGICLSNLGVATLLSGEPQVARTLQGEALLILRKSFGEQHVEVGKCLMKLGNASLSCGDLRGAKQNLDEALSILKYSLGDNDILINECHLDLYEINQTLDTEYGEELYILGNEKFKVGAYEEAINLLTKALPIFKNVSGAEHLDVGMCSMLLGSAMLACGELEAGKKHLHEALGILEANNHEAADIVKESLRDIEFVMIETLMHPSYTAESITTKKHQSVEEVNNTNARAASSVRRVTKFNNMLKRHGLFSHEKKNFSEQRSLFDKAIPVGFSLWEAKGKGDCFYDSCAQELNERAGENEYTIKSLRLLCHQYAVELDKRCNANPQHPDNWISKALNHDLRKYQEYLANVQYTVEERETGEGLGDDKLAIWGEVHIDGRILCEQLRVKLHVIEMRENPDDETNETQKFILSHNLVNERGLRNVEEDKIDWKDEKLLHIAVCNLHFVPILRNTAKQTSASDLDIGQYNDTDHYDTSLDGTDKSREIKAELTQFGKQSSTKGSQIALALNLDDSIPMPREKLQRVARECFELGLISEALALLSYILEIETSVDGLLLRAQCQLELHDFDEAAVTVSVSLCQALSDEHNREICTLLSDIDRCQLLVTTYHEKINTFQTKSFLSVDDQIQLADNFRCLRLFNEAIKILDQVAKNKPCDDKLFSVYFILAQCYYGLQQYEKAQKYCHDCYLIKKYIIVVGLSENIQSVITIIPKVKELLYILEQGSSRLLSL